MDGLPHPHRASREFVRAICGRQRRDSWCVVYAVVQVPVEFCNAYDSLAGFLEEEVQTYLRRPVSPIADGTTTGGREAPLVRDLRRLLRQRATAFVMAMNVLTDAAVLAFGPIGSGDAWITQACDGSRAAFVDFDVPTAFSEWHRRESARERARDANASREAAKVRAARKQATREAMEGRQRARRVVPRGSQQRRIRAAEGSTCV